MINLNLRGTEELSNCFGSGSRSSVGETPRDIARTVHPKRVEKEKKEKQVLDETKKGKVAKSLKAENISVQKEHLSLEETVPAKTDISDRVSLRLAETVSDSSLPRPCRIRLYRDRGVVLMDNDAPYNIVGIGIVKINIFYGVIKKAWECEAYVGISSNEVLLTLKGTSILMKEVKLFRKSPSINFSTRKHDKNNPQASKDLYQEVPPTQNLKLKSFL
ncbi:hypothetical protein CR513_28251, partial [Mucuna pruriens]